MTLTDGMLYDAAGEAARLLLSALPGRGESGHMFSRRFERRMRRLLPKTPEYGTVGGPFTEIDPAAVNLKRAPYVLLLDGKISKSDTGFTEMLWMTPENGKYLVMTVKNDGDTALCVNVMRPYAISQGVGENFTSVKVASGETLTRVFEIADDADELQSCLKLAVNTGGTIGGQTNATVAVEQCN